MTTNDPPHSRRVDSPAPTAARRVNIELLDAFVHGFYGYGTYRAGYWFIGMEEGGGDTLEEITDRLSAWNELGRRELEEVSEFHRKIRKHDLFEGHARLQPTWNRLIRIVLAAQGQQTDRNRIREYQKTSLGRLDGDTCLLELLPLPSPSTQHWLYSALSDLPYLVDRRTYRGQVAEWRAAALRDRVARYQPRAVVFYGESYHREYWTAIAGTSGWTTLPQGFRVAEHQGTAFVSARHPAARGLKGEYFQAIGHWLAQTTVQSR